MMDGAKRAVTRVSAWGMAADRLAGLPLDGPAAETAEALLSKLGARDLAPVDRQDMERLLRVTARLDRIFALQSPDMPGLFFFGAEVSPMAFGAAWGEKRGVSGAGFRVLDAFRRCVGEAVEYLSQHEFVPLAAVPADDWAVRFAGMGEAVGDPPGPVDGHPGRLVPGDLPVGVPVDFCWRRAPARRRIAPRFAPGLGCAAGATVEQAAASALLEVVERDALALWWRGGRRGRAVPVELIARSGAAGLLLQARGEGSRRTWFLDLTTEIGVPVMAALSIGQDGAGFAFGVAAALDAEDALIGACLQLGQLELADLVVEAKRREGGEAALNGIDRMHRRRAAAVAGDWPILHPAGAPAAAVEEEGEHPGDAAGRLAALLAKRGHPAVLVEQTVAEIGVPVMRALVPTLQPDPGAIVTGRLAATRAAAGDTQAASRPQII